MNYQRRQAAVTRYLLLIQGKSEQEIRELLAADDEKFTPEEVEEIYQELVNPKPPEVKSKYTVHFGVYIPDHGKEFTKEEIEADQDIIDYLVDIKSGAVSIIEESKV